MSVVYELMNEINARVEELIDTEFREVKPEELGLDLRVGFRLFINEGFIVARKSNRRPLDYYGGFEYVDRDYVKQYGDFVIYSAEDSRVCEVIDCIVDSFEEMADA